MSLLAQAAPTAPVATNLTPAWVIPAITAVAVVLGAIVGGFATYKTSAAAHNRQQTADDQRERERLLRDVSIRFLEKTMTGSMKSFDLGGTVSSLTSILRQLKDGQSQEELAGIAAQIAGVVTPTDSVEKVTKVMAGLGSLEAPITEISAIVSEMRLVAPGDVVDAAQKVSIAMTATAMFRHEGTKGRAASEAFNQLVEDFANLVRSKLSLESHAMKEETSKSVSDLIDSYEKRAK